MNILISNDDGILARGLAVLGEVCAALGQVTVVAPDREQSGTSHSLTLHRPLHATRRPDGAFQVDGTPTDCDRSEEHTSELQSHSDLVCRLLLEKKKRLDTAEQVSA